MKRENGYYWCKLKKGILENQWDIFIWSDNWYDGTGDMYLESDFVEIDEKRIVR